MNLVLRSHRFPSDVLTYWVFDRGEPYSWLSQSKLESTHTCLVAELFWSRKKLLWLLVIGDLRQKMTGKTWAGSSLCFEEKLVALIIFTDTWNVLWAGLSSLISLYCFLFLGFVRSQVFFEYSVITLATPVRLGYDWAFECDYSLWERTDLSQLNIYSFKTCFIIADRT